MSRRTVCRELRASRDERKRLNAKLSRMAQAIRRGQPTQEQYDQLQRWRYQLTEMRMRLGVAETKMWIPESQWYHAESDISAVERKIDILTQRGVRGERTRARSA